MDDKIRAMLEEALANTEGMTVEEVEIPPFLNSFAEGIGELIKLLAMFETKVNETFPGPAICIISELLDASKDVHPILKTTIHYAHAITHVSLMRPGGKFEGLELDQTKRRKQ